VAPSLTAAPAAPIRSTADLPFVERDPWALLGIDRSRGPGQGDVDEGWDSFGYAWLPQLALEWEPGRREVLAGVLLLALHSEDDAPALPGDIELAFWLDASGGAAGAERPLVVSAPLSVFLGAWLPRLLAARPHAPPRALVLALCNPQRTRLPRPAVVPAGCALWYAIGSAAAWAEEAGDGGPALFGLTAPAWAQA
jgi:hypothetical protein